MREFEWSHRRLGFEIRSMKKEPFGPQMASLQSPRLSAGVKAHAAPSRRSLHSLNISIHWDSSALRLWASQHSDQAGFSCETASLFRKCERMGLAVAVLH